MPKLNKEQKAYQHAKDCWYIFGGFVIGQILGFILGFQLASYNL
jgi:ABC-type nitrate/sulfonate/bicarbonate transport system permease component